MYRDIISYTYFSRVGAMAKLVHFRAEDVTRLFPTFSVHYKALRDTMMDYSVKKNIVQPVRNQIHIPGTSDRCIVVVSHHV